MTSALRRVVLTGAECTGKSTLTRLLAARHGVPYSREAARAYAEVHPVLSAADVEPIARAQLDGEDAARARAQRLGAACVLHDTDLLSTVVYARHYYGACPAWIEGAARARLADLYLLLHPDVPWVPDAARDEHDSRAAQHALFVATLAAFGAHAVDVAGAWQPRERDAEAALVAFMART